MATQTITSHAEIFKREQLEQFTQDWHHTLTTARHFLFNQEWPQAVVHYWRAYPLAEQLLNHSICRNCALKAYIRTLTELAYSLRKNQQSEKLSAIIALSAPTFRTQLTPALAQELMAIVNNIAQAPLREIDEWMEGLFAMDAALNQPIH